jgi:hypothetical protein
MATITTTYNVGQWVYGYTNGEAYSGAIESVQATIVGTTVVQYKLLNRTALVMQTDLATTKAALISKMTTLENAANTAKKAANTTIINALPTS